MQRVIWPPSRLSIPTPSHGRRGRDDRGHHRVGEHDSVLADHDRDVERLGDPVGLDHRVEDLLVKTLAPTVEVEMQTVIAEYSLSMAAVTRWRLHCCKQKYSVVHQRETKSIVSCSVDVCTGERSRAAGSGGSMVAVASSRAP